MIVFRFLILYSENLKIQKNTIHTKIKFYIASIKNFFSQNEY